MPKKVKLERYTLEDEKLILYYNAAYGKMDTVREVLCRAALVRSLTQIDGVDLVMICVDGTPLTDKKGILMDTSRQKILYRTQALLLTLFRR